MPALQRIVWRGVDDDDRAAQVVPVCDDTMGGRICPPVTRIRT